MTPMCNPSCNCFITWATHALYQVYFESNKNIHYANKDFWKNSASSVDGTTQLLLHKVTLGSSSADVTGQTQYLLTHDDVIGEETGRTILLQQVIQY